jgi:hypothetical protein
MLQALSPMVAVALARAQEARERATAAGPGQDRQFWLEMERRWMMLAQSYQMTERVNALLSMNCAGNC